MSQTHFSINESLWIRGEAISQSCRNARSETQALIERGARVFMLKDLKDQGHFEEVRRLLWQSDAHVVLSWILPRELHALQPLLRERKNFSLVADDWWIQPHWFMREAERILFRKYQGVAVRSGQAAFLDGPEPPWLLDPRPQVGLYTAIAAACRPAALAITPAANAWNYFRRRGEPVAPERYLFLPFAIYASDVPIRNEKIEYDFANTGSSCGIWFMRDPYAPFRYTFANLYYDRQLLMDAMAKFEDKPFKFYDCRRVKQRLPYDEYARKNQQARYLLATGGLQNTSLPKYLEYVCVGTPLIGTPVRFEYPWLDECLFPLDLAHLAPEQLKPRLEEALERYPVLRENCLKWRERLLKLYSVHELLNLLQDQLDGKPIPPGYLKPDAPAAAAKQNRVTPP